MPSLGPWAGGAQDADGGGAAAAGGDLAVVHGHAGVAPRLPRRGAEGRGRVHRVEGEPAWGGCAVHQEPRAGHTVGEGKDLVTSMQTVLTSSTPVQGSHLRQHGIKKPTPPLPPGSPLSRCGPRTRWGGRTTRSLSRSSARLRPRARPRRSTSPWPDQLSPACPSREFCVCSNSLIWYNILYILGPHPGHPHDKDHGAVRASQPHHGPANQVLHATYVSLASVVAPRSC
jgi:hypothetical protein